MQNAECRMRRAGRGEVRNSLTRHCSKLGAVYELGSSLFRGTKEGNIVSHLSWALSEAEAQIPRRRILTRQAAKLVYSAARICNGLALEATIARQSSSWVGARGSVA